MAFNSDGLEIPVYDDYIWKVLRFENERGKYSGNYIKVQTPAGIRFVTEHHVSYYFIDD